MTSSYSRSYLETSQRMLLATTAAPSQNLGESSAEPSSKRTKMTTSTSLTTRLVGDQERLDTLKRLKKANN